MKQGKLVSLFLCNYTKYSSWSGYFREEDFVTADEAMKILHLGQNRNRFFDLIKVYKVQAQTFNGVKIGYKKEEIFKLKEKITRT